AIALFLFPYLTRNFGLGYAQAGAIVGIVNGLSTAVGIVGGGQLADFLGKRDVRWYAWAPAIAMLIAMPLYVFALTFTSGWLIAVILLFVPATIVPAFSPTIATTIQSLVEPRMRGTTAAISSALAHIISLGFGAAITGFASDYFGARAFHAAGGIGDYATSCISRPGTTLSDMCAQASASGLRYGLISISVFLVWASLHFFFASRSIRSRFGTTTEAVHA
ncbi:MAG: MFS transporter, partial [bacterium]|nr:MFS transporter [bacterium]